MENDEEYKHLMATINDLEMRANILSGGVLEQARDKTKKEIDLHFENFFKALEAKKDALYHDVDAKYQSLKATQDGQHQHTKQLVEDAKRNLSAGSLVYAQHPKLAGSVWKKALVGTNETIRTLDVAFPSVPPSVIDTYGTVSTVAVPLAQYTALSQQSTQNKKDAEATAKPELDQRLKILLIGDSKVGKSCMMQQYVDNTFTVNSLPTIGADFKLITITLNGKPVKLQIWDMSGADRFRTLAPGFFNNTHGILLTFDVTSQDTLGSLKSWLGDVAKFAPPNVVRVIAGNKADLHDSRVIEFEVAKKLAEQAGIPYVETSATDAKSVREAFTLLITKVIQALEAANHSNAKAGATAKNKEDCVIA